MDYPNNTLGAPMSLPTLEECAATCTATVSCIMFVYGSISGWPNTCWLKSKIGGSNAKAGLVAYKPYDLATANMDYLHYTQTAGSGATLDECRARCLSSMDCKMFQYGFANGAWVCYPGMDAPGQGGSSYDGLNVFLPGEEGLEHWARAAEGGGIGGG